MGATKNMTPGFEQGSEYVDLVQSIVDKTKEGKIDWMISSQGYETKIVRGGAISISLVVPKSPFRFVRWSLFTIRSTKKNKPAEILSIGNHPIKSLIFSVELVGLIDELYEYLFQLRQKEITDAKDVIDNL